MPRNLLVIRHCPSSVPEHNLLEKNPFFAHEVIRAGQKEMLEESRNTLANNGHHLAAAPTGIGKTAAALAAALDARSNSVNKKIFFLTGRQSQHKIVIETIRTINNSLEDQKISCEKKGIKIQRRIHIDFGSIVATTARHSMPHNQFFS